MKYICKAIIETKNSLIIFFVRELVLEVLLDLLDAIFDLIYENLIFQQSMVHNCLFEVFHIQLELRIQNILQQ